MTESSGEVTVADAIGLSPATAASTARALASRLPAALVPLFDATFIRSCGLYEEFVHRLTLRVVRTTGLEAALREPGGVAEVAMRAGLDVTRALVPMDWMLRHLAVRGLLDSSGPGGPACRFRARHVLPEPDPAPVREAQRHHDPTCLPSYDLAETAAQHYPAFLRGEVAGEEILASPARLQLWSDYFSNDNGLYAVNNHVGAVAMAEWMPPGSRVVLELGGGLGSGAVALLDRLERLGRLGEMPEYRFTELVPALLRRGQRAIEARFPGVGRLTFGTLDMNRPFADQGVGPGSLGAVYAVNTLHVAYDLAFTLREISQALAPGGCLVASECLRPFPGQPVYVEFVFNLLETFRAPRLEASYRPNGGFLTPEQWTDALEAAGLVNVRLLPDVTRLRDAFPAFFVAAIGATRAA
jgi:SAM-dependent methyltransferase